MIYINNIEISLIGPYPPPYGGVSIHIQRLREQLTRQHIKCIVYDTSRVTKEEVGIIAMENMIKWLQNQFLHHRRNILHCHGYSPLLMGILSLLAIVKRKRAVITLHSFRYDTNSMSLLDKFAFWAARKAENYFIVVSHEIRNKIISLSIRPENIEVIPSFIPPTVKEEDVKEIPQGTWNFIDSHSPVILANAFKIVFYNNQDLYGIDMCVEMCARLKRYYPNIGLVFCLPDIGDHNYFNQIKQRIKEKGIEDNFFFQTKPCQMYPLFTKTDVFVRPTNTDGDAVSIREALYFKVPSVASDVVPRPEGSVLFKNRDIDDFISKVKDILDNYEEHKKRLEAITLENNAEKIMKVYQKLVNKL